MKRVLTTAVGITLVLLLVAWDGASPLTGNPPVANDVTVNLQPGEFAAIAFDFSDPDGDFVFVNFIGDATYSGATDTGVLKACFCRVGAPCSCSASVTAGQESGTVTFPYTVQDSTGLVSGVATVTIIVGGGARTADRVLNEIEFAITRAVDGANIRSGIASSLLMRSGLMRSALASHRERAFEGYLRGFVHEVQAQSGRGIGNEVASFLLHEATELESLHCRPACFLAARWMTADLTRALRADEAGILGFHGDGEVSGIGTTYRVRGEAFISVSVEFVGGDVDLMDVPLGEFLVAEGAFPAGPPCRWDVDPIRVNGDVSIGNYSELFFRVRDAVLEEFGDNVAQFHWLIDAGEDGSIFPAVLELKLECVDPHPDNIRFFAEILVRPGTNGRGTPTVMEEQVTSP